MIRTPSIKILWILLGLFAPFIIAGWGHTENSIDLIGQETLGIAIQGYDPVAYHKEGRAVKGNSVYAYTWNEAEWHFASAEHRDLFAADPQKFAPHRAGY